MPSKIDKRSRLYEICKLLNRKVVSSTEWSCKRYIEGLYKVIIEQLELNGEIVLPKFGRFYLEHVDDKEMITQWQNKEKQHIYVNEKDIIKFTPYKELRDEINKKYGEYKTVEHGNKKDVPLNATVANLFQRANERRKDLENGKTKI